MTDTFRALSCREPWASLIVHAIKSTENRQWRTFHRGRLLIHASLGTPDAISWCDVFEGGPRHPDAPFALPGTGIVLPAVDRLPRGCIVGCVEVYDCLAYDDLPPDLADDPFASGPWCWLLEHAVAFPEPIRAKGGRRLWAPPPAVLRGCRAALEAALTD
jgi:hypothetical protein